MWNTWRITVINLSYFLIERGFAIDMHDELLLRKKGVDNITVRDLMRDMLSGMDDITK